MSCADEMTLLRSLKPRGAVKSYLREPSGLVAENGYQLQKLWRASTAVIASFDEMADLLSRLVEEQETMVVRAAPKPGVDLSQPIVRRTSGDRATLVDVPRRWLHLDLDRLAAPHVDVIGDPSGAIDFALDAVATAAPELEGASCFASFSAKAGVFNVSAVKVHLFYWLGRRYCTDEVKRWAKGVNERAGFGLVDLSLFSPGQPNYTGRPVFGLGVIDPLLSTRRWSIRHGYDDAPNLVIPEPASYRARPATGDTVQSAPTGGWKGYLDRIDGDGPHGLRRPAFQAMSSRVGELGAERAEAERADIIATVAARLDAAPAGDRPASTVAAYASDLPRQFTWIIERQVESESAATTVKSTYASAGVPVAAAGLAITVAVENFMEQKRADSILALKVSTGVGKTEAVLKALAKRPHLRAAMMVPRHKLTDELLKRAAALGIKAAAWRGREARNPDADDGSTMCIEPEILQAAKRAALIDEACKVCPSRPRCPFFIANDRAPAELEVIANNFLFRKPPALIAGKRNKIDVLILDEAFIDKRIDDPRMLLLDAVRVPSLQRALREAYADGWLLRRHLTNVGIDEEACREHEAAEWRLKPKVPKLPGVAADPTELFEWAAKTEAPKGAAAAQLAEALRKYAGLFDTRAALLWRAVGEFLSVTDPEKGDTQAGAIELVEAKTAEGAAPAVRFRVKHEMHETWHGIPKLVLDAETMPSGAELGDLLLLRPLRIEVAAEVPESVTVRQLVSPLPISALIDRDGAAKPKLVDVADRVEVLARQYAGRGRDGVDVLAVGGTISIGDRLRADLVARGLDVAPKAGSTRRHPVEVRHCGDLAGEDAYGGVRALVQVGWSLPPVRALERHVGAVAGIMPGRLPGDGWALAFGGLRLRDGTGYRVERPVHHNPGVEQLRHRKTEGEMAQALGRARWARRDAKTPLDLWILSLLPLPGLVVDRVLRWPEVALGRLELAFWRLGGVLPCRPTDLLGTRLWPSERAVKAALKGQFRFIVVTLKGNCTFELSPARYRRVNQSRWSSALVGAWLAPEAAAGLLRAATGVDDLMVELATTVAPSRPLRDVHLAKGAELVPVGPGLEEEEIRKPPLLPDELFRRAGTLHRPLTAIGRHEGPRERPPRLYATLGSAGLTTFPAAFFSDPWQKHADLVPKY